MLGRNFLETTVGVESWLGWVTEDEADSNEPLDMHDLSHQAVNEDDRARLSATMIATISLRGSGLALHPVRETAPTEILGSFDF